MNYVILTGRFVKDPETLYGQATNKPWVVFTLAVDANPTKRGGEKGADFIDCRAFDTIAETIGKFFKKGKKILLWGRLKRDKKTMKDGSTRYDTIVLVSGFEFADKAADLGNVQEDPRAKEERQAKLDEFMDIPKQSDFELPFN